MRLVAARTKKASGPWQVFPDASKRTKESYLASSPLARSTCSGCESWRTYSRTKTEAIAGESHTTPGLESSSGAKEQTNPDFVSGRHGPTKFQATAAGYALDRTPSGRSGAVFEQIGDVGDREIMAASCSIRS